jgi:hypothetical protein
MLGHCLGDFPDLPYHRCRSRGDAEGIV